MFPLGFICFFCLCMGGTSVQKPHRGISNARQLTHNEATLNYGEPLAATSAMLLPASNYVCQYCLSKK